MQWKDKIFLILIFLLALTNVFVWKEVFGLNKGLEVIFFDVEQGDSIFVKTGEGHQILIDAGPSGRKILEKLSDEIPFWDRTIDLVILTHPESDHLTGLNYVLQRYHAENILWTGATKETKTFESWLENLEKEKEQGAEIFISRRGQKITAGQAVFYILYPFDSLDGQSFEKASNDTSMVSKLIFGENSFLFTGDITEKIEKELLMRSDLTTGLSTEILKTAHHGAKNSSSQEFLRAVRPKIAVISCGENNPYGHPSEQVLQRLREFAIKVLRTDQSGDIEIISDGDTLRITNFSELRIRN